MAEKEGVAQLQMEKIILQRSDVKISPDDIVYKVAWSRLNIDDIAHSYADLLGNYAGCFLITKDCTT